MFSNLFLLLLTIFILLNPCFGQGQEFSAPGRSLQGSDGQPVKNDRPEIHGIMCPTETIVNIYGPFTYPATNATWEGTLVTLGCPFGLKVTGAVLIFPSPANADEKSTEHGAQRICYIVEDAVKGYIGKWVELDSGKACRQKTVDDTTIKAKNMFVLPQTITVHNVKQAPLLLWQLLEYSLEDYSSATTLIESVSRVLESSEIFMSEPEDPIMNTIKDELLGIIEIYTLHVMLYPGERVTVETTSMKVETVLFPANSVLVSSYGFESLKLSWEAISMARGNTTTGEARLQMTAYGNDLFYHWDNDKNWDADSPNCNPNAIDNNTVFDEGFRGKWRIISLYFNGIRVENLTDPIVYDLPVVPPKDESKQWVCAFWDTTEKKWSSRGMRTLTFSNSVRCESTHLTAFSALLDPIPMGLPGTNSSSIPSIHLHILSILSSVGSALSITGLALTSLTYGLFRCMRKERSNKILLHLCLSLLFLHLMSMSSEPHLWGGHCAVPAFLLHYFLLSSVAWMLVEGIHMYQLLISVFVKPETRFLLKRLICAYGIPLVIVAISGSIDIEAYSIGREEGCLMAGHMPLYIITYLGPVTITLAINAFVFFRIVQVLCKQSSRAKQQQIGKSNPSPKKSNLKKDGKNSISFGDNNKFVKGSSAHLLSAVQIKGAITVMLLLGVGWILGLLAIGPFQLVFRYLFCICNAGQGVFIFLFRVILHPQACRTWRRAVLGASSVDSEAFSSGTGTRRGQSRPSFSVSPTFVSGSGSNSVETSLTRSDPMSTKLANALAALIHQNSSGNAINEETKHY